MSRIVLKPLRSKKQLRRISFKDVISAGFTDDTDRIFTITFNCGNGEMIDLTVFFETRSPHIYISDAYKEG